MRNMSVLRLRRRGASGFPARSLFLQSIAFRLLSTSSRAKPNDGDTRVRSGPPPIRVGLTQWAGRGVFATRKIKAGDLIHTAKPILAHPSLSHMHTVCYCCLRKPESSEAFDVPDIVFCSEKCREKAKGFHDVERRADWSAFDDYCRLNGFKYPLLVKRFACMVISGTTTADTLDILQPAALNPEMILKLEEGHELLLEAFRKANFKDENVAFLTKQWYSGVLARFRINSFRVELAISSYEDLLASAAASVEAEALVGNAIYMLPSFYNHDCDPNAHILWFDNADAKLKTLRDIEEGEELRICYIDASMSHTSRQTLLSQGFGFRCNCLRCQCGD